MNPPVRPGATVVMLCRCGAPLPFALMRWCGRPRQPWQTAAVIRTVCCPACAEDAAAQAELLDEAS